MFLRAEAEGFRFWSIARPPSFNFHWFSSKTEQYIKSYHHFSEMKFLAEFLLTTRMLNWQNLYENSVILAYIYVNINKNEKLIIALTTLSSGLDTLASHITFSQRNLRSLVTWKLASQIQ